jgi:O-antigen/teichoic acid export membrane protein
MAAPVAMRSGERQFSLISGAFLQRAGNTLLRLGSLGAKLVFTLYIGRYLGLAEMGTYGLVAAYVAILVSVLGVRFDYVVGRDIVSVTPFEVACKIRDQIVFYAVNYAVLAAALAILAAGPLKGIRTETLLFILSLSILESLASITSGNIVSLKQPVLANILFFIRSSLWTLPAMALGILIPAARTADAIFLWWLAGVSLSLIANGFAWRGMPWGKVVRTPVNWGWILSGAKKCILIWLGTMGAAAATYVDRFAVEHYLTLDFVGIASFYGSFVIAMQSLLHSSVFSFTYPRLISHYRQGDDGAFRRELRHMTVQATLFGGFMAALIGCIVPILGRMFHRPEFADQAFILWMMLFGAWIRSTTESVYFVLYARHQDRLIWAGGLLVLIPAFVCNMVFVPAYGFKGIGYSAVVTNVFLCLWRAYCLTRTPPPREMDRTPQQEEALPGTEERDELF